jgi:hypothetical protein
MNGLDLFGNFEPLNVAFNNQAEVVGGSNVDVRPNNVQHQQQELEDNINEIDVNGSLAKPMLAALETEIHNYDNVTDFEIAYNITLIATAIAKNKELPDEKKIHLFVRQNEREKFLILKQIINHRKDVIGDIYLELFRSLQELVWQFVLVVCWLHLV